MREYSMVLLVRCDGRSSATSRTGFFRAAVSMANSGGRSVADDFRNWLVTAA